MVIRHMVAYGTAVHACVTPGRGGEQVGGIPVFDTVRAAQQEDGRKFDVALVSVPPRAALDAAEEAMDAGIRYLIVPVENMPVHDTMRMLSQAAETHTTIIGPNSVGLISPGRRIKLGAIGGEQPDRAFGPGSVGIISRSGGLTAEVGLQLRLAGLGVSTAVSVGGDAMIGTTPADLYSRFTADDETAAVVYVGEPGSSHEDRLADRIAQTHAATPLFALVPGRFMEDFPQGATFGHAGAVIMRREDSPSEKARRLADSGAIVVETFAELTTLVSSVLAPATSK